MTLVMTTLLCLFLTCLHLLQEEGSVEVDALEDELEEDAPRPAHRSRSILVLVELPPIGTTVPGFFAFLAGQVFGVF